MRNTQHKQERGTHTNLFALPHIPYLLNESKLLLEEQKGILTVLIHPFFFEYSFDEKLADVLVQEAIKRKHGKRKKINAEVTELNNSGYLLRLEKMLRSRISLIVVGEYEPFASTTIKLLSQLGFAGDILLYDTEANAPTPAISVGNWDKVANALLALQPKKIVVAGQLNQFANFETKKEIPRGCVPGFARNIKNRIPRGSNIEVLISPVVYPNWWFKNEQYPFFRSRMKRT